MHFFLNLTKLQLEFCDHVAESDILPRRDFLPPERRTLVKYQAVSMFDHDYMIL